MRKDITQQAKRGSLLSHEKIKKRKRKKKKIS